MGQIPAGPLNSFEVRGLGTIRGYSPGRIWVNGMITMVVESSLNFNDPGTPNNDVDDFLNALASYTWVPYVAGSDRQVKLKGSNTPASAAAVTTISVTYGVPVNLY